MADRVTIDIEARFSDKTSSGIKSAQKNMDSFSKSAEKAKKKADELSKSKVKPKVDAEDSSFLKKMKKADDKISSFGKSKAEASLGVSDGASKIIDDVLSKAKYFADRNYYAQVGVKTSNALKLLGQINSELSVITGKKWNIVVGFTDRVTAPMKALVSRINSHLGLTGTGISKYGSVTKAIQIQANYQEPTGQASGAPGTYNLGAPSPSTNEGSSIVSKLSDWIGIISGFGNLFGGMKNFAKGWKGAGTKATTTTEVASKAASAAASSATSSVMTKIGSGARAFGGRAFTTLGGSATTSSGLASAAGLGAVAGGVIGGATAISGAKDLYDSANATNEYDRKANRTKGISKIGGVAAGAAIGAIGGPVGALIGAGVGGLVGILAGDKLSKKTAKSTAELREYAKVSDQAAEQLEKVEKEQEKLAQSSIDKHFGKVSMSASDMSKTIENIFGTQKISQMEKANEALNTMKQSYENVKTASYDLDKNIWLTSTKKNAKLTTEEVDTLKASVDSYIGATKQNLTDSHYASTTGINTIGVFASKATGKDNTAETKGILAESDNYFNATEAKLDKLGSKYKAMWDDAMKDSYISPDEEKSLAAVKEVIDKINAELAAEDYESNQRVIKERYGSGSGETMTGEDFATLIEESSKAGSEMADSLWENFGSASKGLKGEELDKLKVQLYEGLMGIDFDTVDFGLDTLTEKYSEQLGFLTGEIPDILQTSKNEIMGQVSSMSEEDRAAIGEFLDKLAPQKEDLENLASKYTALGQEVPENIKNALAKFDLLQAIADSGIEGNMDALEQWFDSQELEGDIDVFMKANPKLVEDGDTPQDFMIKMLSDKFFNTDPTDAIEVGIPVLPKPNMTETDMNEAFLLKQNYKSKFIETLSNSDPFDVTLTAKPKVTVSDPDADAVYAKAKSSIDSVFGDKPINTTAKINVKGNPSVSKLNLDKDDFGVKENYSYSPNIGVKKDNATVEKLSLTRSSFGVKSSYSYSPSITITPAVTINKTNISKGDLVNEPQARGNIFRGYAAGGMVHGGPQVVTVAEEGTPEAIIPLGTHRRQRGLELWHQAGQMLGVKGYAEGGVVGNTPVTIPATNSGSGSVEVGSVQINIEAKDGQTVLDTIVEQKDAIAEEVAGVINMAIKGQYANTPTRG